MYHSDPEAGNRAKRPKRQRGIPVKGQESSFGIWGVVFFDITVLLGLLLSIWLPSYHYTTVAFITGAYMNFDVGLFRVYVTGRPYGLLDRMTGRMVSKFLNLCVDQLNGRSLNAFQNLACGIDTMFYQMVPTGCNTIIMLRIVSYLLVAFLILAAIFQAVGAWTLVFFFYKNRSKMLQRLLFFFHVTPGILVLVGTFIYVMIGGVQLDMAPKDLAPVVADVSPVDLGSGFFICAGFGVLSILGCLFLYFVIPKRFCYDSQAYIEAAQDEQTELLVDQLRTEANRLYPSGIRGVRM